MKTYAHLLLDLDGTLLASSGASLRFAFIQSALRYLRRRGVPHWQGLKALHLMRKAIEKPGQEHTNEQRAHQAFARALSIEEAEARALAAGMIAEIFPTLRAHFQPIPGAREFIDWAKPRFALTLATNPVWPREIVELRLGWAGLKPDDFGFISHASEMHACKPCVEYYRELKGRLGLDPSAALMIGDSPRKDGPARQAGLEVFLLKKGDFPALKSHIEMERRASS
jgi:FMN phosphatase YigB (HAD superfamily)